MLRAVVDDCSRIPGVVVHLLRDARLPPDDTLRATIDMVTSAAEERRLIERITREVDAVLLIAPEIEGALSDRVTWVERIGGCLVSPGSDFIRSTGNKNVLAERLRQAGVRVPGGMALSAEEPLPSDFHYPAVLKPADGAGSCGVRLIARATDPVERSMSANWRLEEFQRGPSASVAVLNGPAGRIPLPAMWQRLGGTSGFDYLGGAGPLPDTLNRRAQRLALAALDALPPTQGYVGVDLILGDDSQGRQDTVIEVNPRLTTSYVGLRRLCAANLAQSMLDVAQGSVRDMSFHVGSLEFDSDGRTILDSATIEP